MHSSVKASEASVTASFGDVLLNEFRTSPSSAECMELFNTLGTSIDIQNWQIWRTSSGAGSALQIMGNVTSAVTIPANGYVLLNDSATNGNMNNFYLSDAGDTIVLQDDGGNTIDVVAYGVEGGAPAHPYGSPHSSARVGTGDTNASDWNVDLSATLGGPNDAPGTDLGGTDIIINEACVDQNFVELYNKHSYNVIDLDGWFMTGATHDPLYLSGTINPRGLAVFQDLSPGSYDFLQLQYYSDPDHVIHLYNSTGHRVAQLGWNTNVDPQSWGRYPDGNTTGFYDDGWDNETSGFVPLSPTPGAPNSDQPYTQITDFIVNQTTAAIGDSVDVAVKVAFSNGTTMDDTVASVSVNLTTPIDLTYDAGSEYFNGTIDFTGYTPSPDEYGIYHTTELEANATSATFGTSIKSIGVLVNPGYADGDTVIMCDEAHDQYYTFSQYAASAQWTSMLLETGIAEYIICTDMYDYHFRIDADVLTDVDLLVITSPDTNLAENALQTSEVDAILDYVENGGSLWFSGEGGGYADPDTNGLLTMTEKWGIEWFDGYYQDPTHNTGQDNHAIVEAGTFDDFNVFSCEEFYFNGMVINHSTQYAGTTVTEIISPRIGSNWDSSDDPDYDPNMNPITDIYALAYLVENGSGKAIIMGSSSFFGHYEDFEDGYESAQFGFNAFCYLLGITPVQYPTLQLNDVVGPQTVTNDNSSVMFKVKINSTLAGATFYDVEVEGNLDGDYIVFSDADSDGIYEGTWDATSAAADTYTLTVSASAETEAGARFIDSELDITVVVQEAEETEETTTTETTATKTKTEKPGPGFEISSVLVTFVVIGLITMYIRRRRR